jgi:hypothetical protein
MGYEESDKEIVGSLERYFSTEVGSQAAEVVKNVRAGRDINLEKLKLLADAADQHGDSGVAVWLSGVAYVASVRKSKSN